MSTVVDEETVLKEFLDEEVRCEGDASKDPHAADVYLRFECSNCGDTAVGPECIPCWQELQVELAANPKIPCFSCGVWIDSVGTFTEIGPVR